MLGVVCVCVGDVVLGCVGDGACCVWFEDVLGVVLVWFEDVVGDAVLGCCWGLSVLNVIWAMLVGRCC